jgi:hypothetical protein
MATSTSTSKPTANELIDETMAQHQIEDAPLNTNTTEGVQRTLAAHGAQIKALADMIDGKIEPRPAIRRAG